MNWMKNGLLIWNLALTLGCGYLLVAHFTGKKTAGSLTSDTRGNKTSEAGKGTFKIAYFEMDSLASNFDMVKELKTEMLKREESRNGETLQKPAAEIQLLSATGHFRFTEPGTIRSCQPGNEEYG
jgi:hypothetical protein